MRALSIQVTKAYSVKEVNMIDFVLLAANTADSFSNYFAEILKDKYVYCIKGGSGVGKSTFMKQIIDISTQNGINCLKVPCSSDINSLDMVVLLEKNVAFVDATNPHAVEPSCYGAREVIINLGDYLDCKLLREYDKELFKLVSDKGICYANCYNALKCARLAEKSIDRIYNKWLTEDKVKQVGEEIFNRYIINDSGSRMDINGYLEYLTDGGVKSIFARVLDNRDIIAVKCNNKTTASKVLKYVLEKIKDKDIKTEKYYSITNPENLIAIGFYNYILTTFDVENYDEIYDLNDMYDSVGIKSDLKQILSERKIFDFGIYNACNYFAQAKAIHSVIEEYYIKAMDFTKWEEFKNTFITNDAVWLH